MKFKPDQLIAAIGIFTLGWLTFYRPNQPPIATTITGSPAPAFLGEPVRLVPRSIHDGDTLRVIAANGEVLRIRMCGIDAPELAQEQGKESRTALEKLVTGDLYLRKIEADRYGRTVGELATKSSNINVSMVAAGAAYYYAKYADNCPSQLALKQAETAAQSRRQGIWQRELIRPWDYRKSK